MGDEKVRAVIAFVQDLQNEAASSVMYQAILKNDVCPPKST
jgi:hypothetical protein